MPNPIKYNISTETLSLKKGNFWIGTGDVDKGPTSTTGFYNGITPPSGGYTIYVNKATGGPSIMVANNDASLIAITNSIAGASYTTVNQCFNYFAGQSDKMVVQRDYENIVTNGLVLNLDSGFIPSYPQNGNTWTDLTSNGNNITLTNGPTYNSSNGGSIVFDGTNDYGILNDNSSLRPTSLTECVWVKFNGITGTVQQFTSKYLGNGTLESYALWYYPAWNGWQATITSAGGSSHHMNYNSTPTIGVWYHFAHTFDNTTKLHSMYLNGSLVNSATINFGPGYDTGAYTLGAEYENGVMSFWHNGNLSVVQLYNRSLSSSEITQNYNAQKGRFGY